MKLDIPRSPAASALFCAVLFCTLLLIAIPVTAADTPTEPIAEQDLTKLNNAIQAADGHFTPITETEICQAKIGLLKAVENLDNEFQKIGVPTAEGWKKYLDWDKFTATLACKTPDMDLLKKANQALSAQHRGLELACFVDVQLALEKYMNLRLAVDNPAIQKAYNNLTAKDLPKMLKEYATRPTSNPSTSLAQVVAWLDKFDQASELLAQFQAEFAKPNFYASASKRLISPGFDDEVNEPVDIHDVILKTKVHSTGTMVGKTTLEMIPSETEAILAVKLTGTSTTNNVGRRGPVWIHSDSTSQIEATKLIKIDADGIHTDSAKADVNTDTSIRSICTKRHNQLIENFAWKQACKSRCEAEAIASCRTERRVAREINETAEPKVTKANNDYRKRFLLPLTYRKLAPERLNFSTTEDRLNIVSLQRGLAQFAAWSDPPDIDEASTDAAVRIHESVINNSTWTFLAGRTFSEAEFLELATDLAGGKLPEQFKPDEDQEPWAITFAKENPIRVTFYDNKIQIKICATSFKKGDSTYTAMNIATTYKITAKKDGQFELTRLGDLEVFPPGFETAERQLSVREQTLRKLLEKRFSKIFEPTWKTRPSVPLPKRWESAGELHISHWNTSNGWMTLTWKLKDK